jgi:peroxiredoxin/predicted 2-oxoglutarate/Fe(II)-dependent dioxygenase YbiX
VNPSFNFSSVGGRYVVLTFFGSAAAEPGRMLLAAFRAAGAVFDVDNIVLFGVSDDPHDEVTGRVAMLFADLTVFWDANAAIARQYRVVESAAAETKLLPHTYVLDQRLRVLRVFPLDCEPERHVATVVEFVTAQPKFDPPRPAGVQAPILVIPRVFEPELCQTLIRYYEEHGGNDSGFMVDQGGKTVGVYDYSHKRRRDQDFEANEGLRRACMHRIHDRLIPEIHKAFQFRCTRMERYLVACYEGETGGHFRAHRDNTTLGTAHRRFAVSLLLNAGEYEGGYLRFPEFGHHLYTAPTGGAVVFSCSLLHEATPVTKGKRYVFLPFLYDDAAAKIREENLKFLAGTTTNA